MWDVPENFGKKSRIYFSENAIKFDLIVEEWNTSCLAGQVRHLVLGIVLISHSSTFSIFISPITPILRKIAKSHRKILHRKIFEFPKPGFRNLLRSYLISEWHFWSVLIAQNGLHRHVTYKDICCSLRGFVGFNN